MPNRFYEELTATGIGDIADGKVVRITADNTIAITSGANATVIGVADELISSSSAGRVVIWGRKTVTCTGTVAAGDMVKPASDGEVEKFTPIASEAITNHLHSTEVTDPTTRTDVDSNTISFRVTPGQFSDGLIIGKALTGGTNTTIDIFVKIMG